MNLGSLITDSYHVKVLASFKMFSFLIFTSILDFSQIRQTKAFICINQALQ